MSGTHTQWGSFLDFDMLRTFFGKYGKKCCRNSFNIFVLIPVTYQNLQKLWQFDTVIWCILPEQISRVHFQCKLGHTEQTSFAKNDKQDAIITQYLVTQSSMSGCTSISMNNRIIY